MQKKIKPFVVSVFIALAVGGISALLIMNNMDLYSKIEPPPLAPPSWIFPVVWTILYILMGISAAMVYLKKDEKPKEDLTSIEKKDTPKENKCQGGDDMILKPQSREAWERSRG